MEAIVHPETLPVQSAVLAQGCQVEMEGLSCLTIGAVQPPYLTSETAYFLGKEQHVSEVRLIPI